jgi:hypothetical protein
MSLEITEYEMIERYVDGLNRSASKAKEIMTAKIELKPLLFVEFVSGVKVAAGCAHQLAHAQENPHFLSIRDLLEGVIIASQDVVVFDQKYNGLWMRIKNDLEHMAVQGRKMATSHALSRTDVLAALDVRQIELNKTLN